jgi:hypothetical protein
VAAAALWLDILLPNGLIAMSPTDNGRATAVRWPGLRLVGSHPLQRCWDFSKDELGYFVLDTSGEAFFFSFLVGATSGGQTVLTTDRGVRPGRDTMVPLLVANPFTRYGSANTRLASSGCLAIPVFLNA